MSVKIGFLSLFLQILLFGFAILFHVEKKKNFWLKFAICTLLGGAACFFVEQFFSNPLLFMVPFALDVILFLVCYKINVFQALFFAIICYALQNLTYSVHALIGKVFPFVPGDYAEIFNYLRARARSWTLYVVFAFAAYFLFARKMRLTLVFSVKNIKVDIFCVVVLCIVYFVNMRWNGNFGNTADVLFRILMIICIATSIWTVLGFAQEVELQRQNEAIEQLLRKEQSLYKLSKEAIDTINRKCHDLKHTVNAVKAGGVVSEEDIKEIEEALRQYDGFIRTGNKDLDIVVAEKYLRCVDNDITLSCIIDGKRLNFMSPGDVYSLFGNLLDNAIEYLETIEDAENRLITVNVQTHNRFVTVHVENYCKADTVFSGGLPPTDKADKKRHGYGTLSIKHVVEKYGGTTVFSRAGNTFSVNIAIPV